MSRPAPTPTLVADGPSPGTVVLPFHIRQCTEAHLDDLEWYGLFTAHRKIIHEAFDAQERGEGLMLIADLNGFPIAQAWLDFVRRQEFGTTVIWALRVFPCLRGVGIGRQVLQAAEEASRDRGFEWTELGVERSNAGARRMYERAGYHVVGKKRGCYSYTPPGAPRVKVRRDELILEKYLIPLE
jgi:ribosomal protein S18 acetylase RimI-like enzyme